MWKTAAIAVTLIAGTGLAQNIPERNCLSNPNMSGCPGEEQARKIQELMNKKADLTKAPGNVSSGTSTTQRKQPVVTANSAPVQDSDWKRPRLSKALPADWPRWGFAPPDAGAVIGMKLKVIVQSPMLRQIVDTAGGVSTEESWKNLQVADGPVDEVWLAVRTVAGRPQPESVMLLIGPGLETIGADLRSKGASICFLDAQSMLAGEWNAVSRALQRVVALSASVFAQKARELWSKDDIVLIASGKMISEMLPAGSNAPPPTGITGVAVGMSMRETLGIDLMFSVATPADATRLAAQFAKNPADLGLPEVQVRKTANSVNAHAELPLDKLPESMRKQISEQLRPVIDLVAQRRPKMINGQSTKGAIVIEGLDDGPRVIPATKP